VGALAPKNSQEDLQPNGPDLHLEDGTILDLTQQLAFG